MARRNASLRKSANDFLFEDGGTPFKSMYSQQFVDPHARTSARQNKPQIETGPPQKSEKQMKTPAKNSSMTPQK